MWSLGIEEGLAHAQKGKGMVWVCLYGYFFEPGERHRSYFWKEKLFFGPVPSWADVVLDIAKHQAGKIYQYILV